MQAVTQLLLWMKTHILSQHQAGQQPPAIKEAAVTMRPLAQSRWRIK